MHNSTLYPLLHSPPATATAPATITNIILIITISPQLLTFQSLFQYPCLVDYFKFTREICREKLHGLAQLPNI